MSKHQIQVKPFHSMSNGWLSGNIDGSRFEAKVYDVGSQYGINNGRVSKLAVWGASPDDVEVISYDRGWDTEPTNDEQRELLRALLEYLEVFPLSEHWEHLAIDAEGNIALKAAMKNVVASDNSNEELIAFAKTIEFAPLFAHIKAFAGVKCYFYQPEIAVSRGNVHIAFTSNGITSQTGAFAAILKSCHIGSFSNGVFKDKDTDELGYWVSVSIRYEHKDGGSNGMNMVTARYMGGKWEFDDAGQGRCAN